MTHHIINFVHANGFPAKSYQTLFNHFPSNIKVIALDKYGHDKTRPVDHNWQAQVDELISFVESQQQGNNKVITVGHSFGGVISFIACCNRPDLFKGLIMLDPPVLTGTGALVVRLLKKTKWIDKFSPAGRAKNRRIQWPLDSNIGAMFAKKALFKSFDKRCLADYITHGVCERNNQLELVFDAQVEANIFRNIPSNLSKYKKKLKVPATLIYGKSTDIFPQQIFKRFVKLNHEISLQTIPGGHMFPMESPEEVARIITKIIVGTA